MPRTVKRLPALLLALVLCIALFPAALAEDAGTIAPAEEPEDAEIGSIAPAGDEPQANVASGWCGEALQWTLNSSGVLTITGAGYMDNWSHSEYAPWYKYWNSITSIKLPDDLTGIGAYAFYYCDKVKSITLPKSLNRIGDSAFACCAGLTGIKIPVSVETIGQYAFSSCYALTSVSLPEGLSYIPDYCFSSCEKLTGLAIPESVESIGQQAFAYCNSMTSIEIPSNVLTIDGCAFYGCKALRSLAVCAPGCNIYDGEGTLGIPGVTTIYGTASSTAKTYAQKYDYIFKPIDQFNPFADVKEGKYYYDAVLWAYHETPRITAGTDVTHFSPNGTVTRGQAVTFLWNSMSQMKPKGTFNPFVDVKSGKYYYTPVLWAYYFNPQITSGTDATHFSPNAPCTREQIVTFLWNLYDRPEPSSTYNPFQDVTSGKYYYKAVLWAREMGITSGVDAKHFGVGQTCTRAQFVTFLYSAKDIPMG